MSEMNLIIAILGLGTEVPEYRLDQADTAQRIARALSGYPDSARWAKRMFKQCGVESRYTCEPNLLEEASNCSYFSQEADNLVPTTAERMKTYKEASVPLGLKAAHQALLDGQADISEITHLITVSCTGQFLPGLDAQLVKGLGLNADVRRIPLTFLGCAAGLKAISLARELAVNNADAKILIVSVELCTLHIQSSSKREDLFGASFFGDGASACIVGRPSAAKTYTSILQLGEDASVLLPAGADEMVWEVGNTGFDLYLSTNIPRLIGSYVPEHIERLNRDGELLELWAIHPGGKGIIDKLGEVFQLTEEQMAPSRNVLRQYGNMSSATILFVLLEMRQELERRREGMKNGIAVAFGPGLSCEMIQIRYLPGARLEQTWLKDSVYV